MKICLYRDPTAAESPDVEAYLSQLAGVLARDHQVILVSNLAALGDRLLRDRPDVLHLNQAAGLSLARLLRSAQGRQFDRVPVALTLHDYRLRCSSADLHHPDGRGCAPRLRCRPVSAINRLVTDSIGLVHSPSRYVLDRHLEQGFFPRATHLVLPYGSGDGSSAVEPAGSTRPFAETDCVVVAARSPMNAPLAIHRAFQAGKIVIASRNGGIPEVVRDGVNGLLVEPGDDRAVARAIERLRQSPELVQQLRTESRRSARLYDLAFHAAHLVRAYEQLISTNRVGPFKQVAA